MRMGMMKSETVALQAYLAMKAGKRRVVHGIMNRLLALSTHITPNGLLLSVANNLMKP
jgi:short-subunit dehydrogenase